MNKPAAITIFNGNERKKIHVVLRVAPITGDWKDVLKDDDKPQGRDESVFPDRDWDGDGILDNLNPFQFDIFRESNFDRSES